MVAEGLDVTLLTTVSREEMLYVRHAVNLSHNAIDHHTSVNASSKLAVNGCLLENELVRIIQRFLRELNGFLECDFLNRG